jgi:hypothetical protein
MYCQKHLTCCQENSQARKQAFMHPRLPFHCNEITMLCYGMCNGVSKGAEIYLNLVSYCKRVCWESFEDLLNWGILIQCWTLVRTLSCWSYQLLHLLWCQLFTCDWMWRSHMPFVWIFYFEGTWAVCPLQKPSDIKAQNGILVKQTFSIPCTAPAARVILSFMSEPPISLQPAPKSACAPPGPIFTHDACPSQQHPRCWLETHHQAIKLNAYGL